MACCESLKMSYRAAFQCCRIGPGRSICIAQLLFIFLGYFMKNLPLTVKSGISACLVAVACIATPSFAAEGIDCQLTDITPNALDCSGFVLGNALNNAENTDPTASALLAELGYVGSLDGIETISLGGLKTIDFATLLFGETIVGIRFGNGQGSPGRPDGDDTVFYKFEAGTAGLDTFTTIYGSSSTARLYKTGVGAVPEPSTWMFMLLGMTGVGFAMRRKDKQTLRVRYT
jgi:hypothetical protein